MSKYFEVCMFEPIVWKYGVEAETKQEAFRLAKERQAETYREISRTTDRTYEAGGEHYYSVDDEEVPWDFDSPEEAPIDEKGQEQ